MSKQNVLYFIAGAIVGAVVATFVGVSNPTSGIALQPQVQTGTVDFLIDSGEVVTFTDVPLGEVPTVFATLQGVSDVGFEEYDEIGVFVKSIGGVKGEGDAWWQYWVNGEHAQIASDKYMLTPGDVVLWKLTAQHEE